MGGGDRRLWGHTRHLIVAALGYDWNSLEYVERGLRPRNRVGHVLGRAVIISNGPSDG
jgi:hypothetical protein